MFWASQLTFGVAASLLVMAVAGLFAMPELTQYYSVITLNTTPAGQVQLLGFGLIGATILVAGLVGWLAFGVGRGLPRTRVSTWVACGVLACASIAVLILRPWGAVPWLPLVLQIVAAVVVVQAVAVAVLLSRPLSGKYFELTRGTVRSDPPEPPPTATPAPVAPGYLTSSGATPSANPADYDPFS